jgi:hypothetical protein
MAEDASALYFVVEEPARWKDVLIPRGDLCRGSLAADQAVEIVQPDGSALPAVMSGKPIIGTVESKKVASADEVGHKLVVMRFKGAPPEAVSAWTLIRAPGPHPSAAPAGWLADPTARHEHRYWDGVTWTEHVSDRGTTGADPLPGAVDRAVAALRQVQASGFLGPLEKGGEDLMGATPETLAARLLRLTRVLAAPKERNDLLVPLSRRARLYARLGMQLESDRDYLMWAALHEGTLSFDGSPAAAAGLFGAAAIAGFGAVGGEFAAAFAASWKHAEAALGTGLRRDLMSKGRAVAVGYCSTCGGAAYLDLDLRCTACHKRPTEAMTAAMPDAQAAWSAVASRHQTRA